MKTHHFFESFKAQCVVFILLLFAILGHAQANIGSINVSAITDTSININWTWPSGSYQPSGSGSPQDYKICYKVGSGGFACAGTVEYDSVNNHMISGLSPSTTYKIKVKCHCKRKTNSGKWRYPRWRTVATIVVSTNATPPDDEPSDFVTSNLIITETTATSFKVKASHNDMLLFDKVHICYRRKWVTNALDFDDKCRTSNPASYWLASDKNLGWIEAIPNILEYPYNFITKSFEANLHPSIDLTTCAKYKITAFGVGGLVAYSDKKIGEVDGETHGPCKLFKMPIIIVEDYLEDILSAYAREIDNYYDKPLFDHLAESYDQNLLEYHQTFLNQEQGNIRNTLTLLTYLIETDSVVFYEWQDEENLNQSRLVLEDFVSSQYPQVFHSIQEEINDQ